MDLIRIAEELKKKKETKAGMSFYAGKSLHMLYYDLNDNWFIQTPKLVENGELSYLDWSNYEQILKIKKENILKSIESLIFKKEKTLDVRGSIYLVTDGKYTKIGATSYAVQKRLFELQTGNAKKLKLVYEYKVKNKLSTEAFLHEKFKNKNVLGEWFELSFEDIEYIIKTKPTIEKDGTTIKMSKKEKEEILHCIKKLKKEQKEKLIKTERRYEYKIYELLKYTSKKIDLKTAIKKGYSKYRTC